MKKPLIVIVIFYLCSFCFLANAQEDIERKSGNLLMKLSYGINFSKSDLSERFGTFFAPGLQLDYILDNGLTFGLSYQFHFGSTVKEDVLFNLRDEQSIILGVNNVVADVFLRQRGFSISPHIGYLMPLGTVKGSNFIHGSFGVGLWQHKIRIIDDQNSVPQVGDTFISGYDRLSNGLALTQALGFTHISTRNAARFFLQIEFMEGFIKNRRDWDFALMGKLDESRFDVTYGFRLGWILPIIQGSLTNGRNKNGDIFY